MSAERDRLEGPDADHWRRWGPYLAERAWGTVREDYSPDGDAWASFPHEHARSRTYRWNEDGLAGLSDDAQRVCFSLAFWNGADRMLKERAFGLTGPQGNHGEDVKEYWWFTDSTPTHSWMRWRYVYPQSAYPYEELVATSAARGRTDPEYELLDTGAFDGDRYFDIVADFAKASPDDLCIRVSVTNRGPEQAVLHLLPTLWFRDTWTWQQGAAPVLEASGSTLVAHDPDLGDVTLTGAGATPLVCDNATNAALLWGVDDSPAYPKDGINDHVVSGAATVNPAGTGTKGALHHVLTIEAGGTAEVRLRLSTSGAAGLGGDFEATMADRLAEADEFYGEIGAGATPDEALVLRSAFAGMLWSKQYYAYDVSRWLDGDPGEPAPPPSRLKIRNARWRSFDAAAVVSMPDPWEYPWFAAWDLAFHCVTLAHVDPAFAKQQLAMVLGDRWMHPTGQVPAYEWDFGAVNPPVHAWAALRVFKIDGARDTAWLRQVFNRLIVNITWWIGKNDPEGDGVFAGGFLGMDNIGPFDRGAVLPDGMTLEQADATGWMALATLSLVEIAAILAAEDPAIEDMAVMCFETFALITRAGMHSGLWNEADGFFYDQMVAASGERWPVGVRSMSGLVPLFGVVTVPAHLLAGMPTLRARVEAFLTEHRAAAAGAGLAMRTGAAERPGLLALVGPDRLARVLSRVGDPNAFLSPHGVRSVSAEYRGAPYVFHAAADDDTWIDYEPAESTTALFGGNSNWRGPVWLPVNFLLVQAVHRYSEALGDDVQVEFPHGSGEQRTLAEIADLLGGRLAGLFLPDAQGHRPVWGGAGRFRDDPLWRDSLLFFEYFEGDDGAGLGASHQTGWTGLVADLLLARIQARTS